MAELSQDSAHDLIADPLWRPEDLGRPIPDSPHAVSVCLPTWRDNIGYEEQDPRVHERISTGYPRFVYNRLCRELFAACEERFTREGEACLAFPSAGAAETFARYMHARTGRPAAVHEFGMHRVHAVRFPREHAAIAKSGWQHCGEGISSRRAEACLTARDGDDGAAAKRLIRERIAALTSVTAGDVFLFPCGMSAIAALHRVLTGMFPGRKSVQFGFPYVDSLKVQETFGTGVHFFPRGDAGELDRLADLLRRETVCGLYTEFPSNPLLISPDVERLASLARRHEFPLVLDETIAGFTNVDLLPVADVLSTSLTKYFSGIGDVTGGSLVLNPRGAFHAELSSRLRREAADDLVWGEDAVVLERNSRDFERRIPRINANADALAEFLESHPKVARVYYPRFQTPAEYRAFQRRGGGCGGLMSIEPADAPANAPRLFDALQVSKGPNLGTNYTLACPYTILAHYNELEFAESCGVSRWLIRVSVGLEDPDDLIGRFEGALNIP